MTALQVFNQKNGDITKAYYKSLDAIGPLGQLGTALFRAQKRSTAAKGYRGRGFRSEAYGVKNWSMGEITRILLENPELGIRWGWGRDENTPGFEWVLYVDIPDSGQCSFHSAARGDGPDYPGGWCGDHGSQRRIIEFCDRVLPPGKPVFGGMERREVGA